MPRMNPRRFRRRGTFVTAGLVLAAVVAVAVSAAAVPAQSAAPSQTEKHLRALKDTLGTKWAKAAKPRRAWPQGRRAREPVPPGEPEHRAPRSVSPARRASARLRHARTRLSSPLPAPERELPPLRARRVPDHGPGPARKHSGDQGLPRSRHHRPHGDDPRRPQSARVPRVGPDRRTAPGTSIRTSSAATQASTRATTDGTRSTHTARSSSASPVELGRQGPTTTPPTRSRCTAAASRRTPRSRSRSAIRPRTRPPGPSPPRPTDRPRSTRASWPIRTGSSTCASSKRRTAPRAPTRATRSSATTIPSVDLPTGPELRTYRLALITDPLPAFFGGPANVTAAKVALMNRVNQVYEDDLTIRMQFIANNDLLT